MVGFHVVIVAVGGGKNVSARGKMRRTHSRGSELRRGNHITVEVRQVDKVHVAV